MAIALRSDRGIRVLAGASGVGCILAICGSNAMTPLLPGYMDTLEFGPAAASVLFATYFIALIIILLISARGPLIRHSRTVLPLALLAAIVGDLLQIVGASVDVLLFPGRFLTGASVGLSTGAAAAIMVAARGERGRAFIASGSLIGAGSGLVAAIAIAVFLPWQLVTVYAIHAAATAVCLIVLLVGLRLAPGLLAYGNDSSTDDGSAPQSTHAHTGDLDVHNGDLDVAGTRRRDPGAYLVGTLAWAIGALAVGAMPAAILATGASDSLLVAQCVGGACLLVSMVASLAGVGVRLVTTLPAVGVLLVVGWSTAVVGLVLGRPGRDRPGYGRRRDRSGRGVPSGARRCHPRSRRRRAGPCGIAVLRLSLQRCGCDGGARRCRRPGSRDPRWRHRHRRRLRGRRHRSGRSTNLSAPRSESPQYRRCDGGFPESMTGPIRAGDRQTSTRPADFDRGLGVELKSGGPQAPGAPREPGVIGVLRSHPSTFAAQTGHWCLRWIT